MKNKVFRNLLVWSLLLISVTSSWFVIFRKINTNINYMEANYIADFDDDRKVLWTADNVFVWKVVANKWLANQIWNSTVPETLFDIEILYNIKWNTKGNITVKQEGGYDIYNNLYIVEWNEYMEVWKIYLLSTKSDSFTINSHPNWSHLLYDGTNKSKSDIKKFIKDNEMVKKWREAYKNEVYYQDDYKISSEKNAYKFLTKEEKDKFEIMDNWFIE